VERKVGTLICSRGATQDKYLAPIANKQGGRQLAPVEY
jgi:hypothetical protein